VTTTCSVKDCGGSTARLLLDGVRVCVDHLLALEGGQTVRLADGGRITISGRWPLGQSPRMRQTLTPRFWRWLREKAS